MAKWSSVALLALSSAGCGASGWGTVPSDGEKEVVLLRETDRVAAVLHVKVRGEITDKLSKYQDPLTAGFYDGGVAYFYRPVIEQYVSLEECPNVAAHEVCHAISRNHDHKHWECMASVASPTYPEP